MILERGYSTKQQQTVSYMVKQLVTVLQVLKQDPTQDKLKLEFLLESLFYFDQGRRILQNTPFHLFALSISLYTCIITIGSYC